MSESYHPNMHDFFPKVRRGHGTTHPDIRTNKKGVQVRNACPCVNAACSLLRHANHDGERRGEPHLDPAMNVREWKEERRFHKDTPLEYCR